MPVPRPRRGGGIRVGPAGWVKGRLRLGVPAAPTRPAGESPSQAVTQITALVSSSGNNGSRYDKKVNEQIRTLWCNASIANERLKVNSKVLHCFQYCIYSCSNLLPLCCSRMKKIERTLPIGKDFKKELQAPQLATCRPP